MAPSPSDLKQAFVSSQGQPAFDLDPGWSSLLHLSPDLFAASLKILEVPKKKNHLTPKIQSLIALSVSAASTLLYTPGIRAHVATALRSGASVAEITEILELTSTLGIHACNIGVPLLVEVLKEEGLYEKLPASQNPLSEKQEQLKADFNKNRGYWHTFWNDFLTLDPEFFEAYLEFSSLPWTKQVGDSTKGALEPKVKELVYCAFDAAATHLYVPGLKLHYRNALGYGASVGEICEVLEIATGLSLHTATTSAGIVLEEVERFEREKE
jgi:alkylhydroperoxidase/carboxymuconolactone decarboxylase family protein YurZ